MKMMNVNYSKNHVIIIIGINYLISFDKTIRTQSVIINSIFWNPFFHLPLDFGFFSRKQIFWTSAVSSRCPVDRGDTILKHQRLRSLI
jgi:hypothetical protein